LARGSHRRPRPLSGALERRAPRPLPVHVVATGDRIAARGSDRAGRVTVFRQAVASWYGPGLYGGGVACGGTLEPGTLGVANRTLPCGTKVTLHYHGRQVTVPVIDRGPYVAGRDYDLTGATRARLHFEGGVGTPAELEVTSRGGLRRGEEPRGD